MAGYADYTLVRGLPWVRKIVPKERYTHRQYRPTDARGWVKTSTTGKKQFSCVIDHENAIVISLTADETWDLPEGPLAYDVLGSLRGFEEPIIKGTITVSSSITVTPSEDTEAMELRFDRFADFRRDLTWLDSNGDVMTVYGALLEAQDSTGAIAIGMTWHNPALDRTAVNALTDGFRAQLTPKEGVTMELFYSGDNTKGPGVYPFDLSVQDSIGDWNKIVSGTIVIEPSISNPYD
jgi:hypothetical protein